MPRPLNSISLRSRQFVVFGHFPEEHCSSDTFHLRCPAPGVDDSAAGSTGPAAQQSRVGGDSEVIVIHRADYGRMRPARRCISAAYAESMGCQADVVEHLHSVCTGRPNCSLLVATMDSVSQPCPKDFKSYVEVVYECITGMVNSVLLACNTKSSMYATGASTFTNSELIYRS